jgi:hypothetical protein
MKFSIESYAGRHKRINEWHKFFCLWPRIVETEDPLRDSFVWLTTIERKFDITNYNWTYRLIKKG